MANKTHGNCAAWTKATAAHVYCERDLFGGCWYSKNGNAQKCRDWKPRDDERTLGLLKLEATYYVGVKEPICVIAFCDDGRKYQVQASHLTQARCAGWTAKYYNYQEGGNAYTQVTWTGAGKPPMRIHVVSESEIGGGRNG